MERLQGRGREDWRVARVRGRGASLEQSLCERGSVHLGGKFQKEGRGEGVATRGLRGLGRLELDLLEADWKLLEDFESFICLFYKLPSGS